MSRDSDAFPNCHFPKNILIITRMEKQDRLAAHRLALSQQLGAVESERILGMVQDYLQELVALQRVETEWTDADQAAISRG